MELKVTVRGEEEVFKKLDEFTSEIRTKIYKSGARKVNRVFKKEVLDRVPIRSGELSKSFKTSIKIIDKNTLHARVYTTKFYAKMVEEGHGGPHPAPAYPFVRPAFDYGVSIAEKEFLSMLRKAIRKYSG